MSRVEVVNHQPPAGYTRGEGTEEGRVTSCLEEGPCHLGVIWDPLLRKGSWVRFWEHFIAYWCPMVTQKSHCEMIFCDFMRHAAHVKMVLSLERELNIEGPGGSEILCFFVFFPRCAPRWFLKPFIHDFLWFGDPKGANWAPKWPPLWPQNREIRPPLCRSAPEGVPGWFRGAFWESVYWLLGSFWSYFKAILVRL